MNKKGTSLFLELVRAAIWNKSADEKLFQDLDSSIWTEIIGFAESQKVNALLYDGIMTLPAPLRPEKKILYKLFLQTEAIEQSNKKLNNELKYLSTEYGKIGCPFVLLKGQGNAALYPNPTHRSPGDIDLYLYKKGDYEKANEWAKDKELKMDAEYIHHHAFELNGVIIENHKVISYFGIKKYDLLLEEKIQEIIRNQNFVTIDIDGLQTKILPVEFNGFYIFYHLFHHFINLGVGFRQFFDWVLFMDAHAQEMDKRHFVELVKQFDLLDAMKVFASVSVKYLGANPTIFPFETDVNGKFVEIVLEDILKAGNFGHYTYNHKSFKGKWSTKWYRFRYSVNRTKKIADIAPQHIKSLAWIKVVLNLKLLFKK